MTLEEIFERDLPRFEEALKHKNRQLAIDMYKSLDTAIFFQPGQRNKEDKTLTEKGKMFKAMQRELKDMLIRAAWEDGETIEIDDRGRVVEDKQSLRERAEEVIRGGGGVFESSKNRFEDGPIRLSFTNTPDPQPNLTIPDLTIPDLTIPDPDSKIPDPSTSILDNPDSLQKYGDTEQIYLDNPGTTCDTPVSDGPFSIEDFTVATQRKKEMSYDELIAQAQQLIEEA
jgi:hypothetical protein